MTNTYIIDGARTPIGAYLGQYKKIESVDLGISCVKGLLDRNPKLQKKEIEGKGDQIFSYIQRSKELNPYEI